jgi:hypothetical protein
LREIAEGKVRVIDIVPQPARVGGHHQLTSTRHDATPMRGHESDSDARNRTICAYVRASPLTRVTRLYSAICDRLECGGAHHGELPPSLKIMREHAGQRIKMYPSNALLSAEAVTDARCQTGDLLQITKYRVARDAADHRFPQVSELIKAEPAPRLPLRRSPLAGLLFEL